MVILSLFAIALFALLGLLERLALPWVYQPSERSGRHEARARHRCAAVRSPCAGCGEKQEAATGSAGSTQQFTLMLDWFPNADHAGIYQALAERDFAKAGLDVHVQVPSDPATPLKLLAAGKIDAAISYEPEVLLARNQDQPLVSVAALVQRPLTSIVSIGSKHITSPAKLKGKRVGDAGIPYQHAYLTTILARAGVPAELGQGDQRRRQPGAGHALGPGRRHARGVLELRGDPARAAPQAPQRDPHGAGRGAHLRRARGRGAQEHDHQPPRRGPALRPGARAAATRRSAATRRRRSTTWSTPAPGWIPSFSWRASRRPCRRSSRPIRPIRGAGRTPSSGPPTASGC